MQYECSRCVADLSLFYSEVVSISTLCSKFSFSSFLAVSLTVLLERRTHAVSTVHEVNDLCFRL